MWPSMYQNSTSQSQALPDGTGSYGYYARDGSSSNQIHQARVSTAQTQWHQPMHQATWGQAGHEVSNLQPNMQPSMSDNINSPQLEALSTNRPASYNNFCNGSSLSNQRPYHAQRQRGPTQHHTMHRGSWSAGQYSNTLPSPVFRSDESNSQPNMWSTMSENNTTVPQAFSRNGAVSYNNYFANGSFPTQNNQAQDPRASMQEHQSMQFTTPDHRPHFSGQFRGGFSSPNHRGGRGARGHPRGNGNAACRGNNRKQPPARSNGKRKEGKHFCDPCERLFNSPELLAQHVSEHRVCGIDGCKLNAHTSVVDKHIRMQHDTGLFLKMKDLFNSNDFAKWRAERKRSYPSKINIEKRQAEQEEKLKRGESLGNGNERFPRNRGGKSKRGQARTRGSRGRHSKESTSHDQSGTGQNFGPKKSMGVDKKNGKEDVSTTLNGATKTSFACVIDEEQIQDIPIKEEKDFSDTEWEPVSGSVDAALVETRKLSTALNSLASMYDSDSGEEATVTTKREDRKISATQIEDDDGAGAPLEVAICRIAPQDEEIADEERPNISHKRRHNRNHQNREEKPKRNKMNGHGGYQQRQSVSLLQKLLSSEIRHERNVVLQCIRYIIENNFLQRIEPTPKEVILEANLQRMDPTPTAHKIVCKEETQDNHMIELTK